MEYGDDYSRAQLAMQSLNKIYPTCSKNYCADYSEKVFGSKPFTFAVMDVYTPRDQPLGPTEVEPGVLAPSARGRSVRAVPSSGGQNSWEEHLRCVPMRTKAQLKHTTPSFPAKSVSSATSTILARSSSRAELPRPLSTDRSSDGLRHARGLRTTIASTMGKIKSWVAAS